MSFFVVRLNAMEWTA